MKVSRGQVTGCQENRPLDTIVDIRNGELLVLQMFLKYNQ